MDWITDVPCMLFARPIQKQTFAMWMYGFHDTAFYIDRRSHENSLKRSRYQPSTARRENNFKPVNWIPFIDALSKIIISVSSSVRKMRQSVRRLHRAEKQTSPTTKCGYPSALNTTTDSYPSALNRLQRNNIPPPSTSRRGTIDKLPLALAKPEMPRHQNRRSLHIGRHF